MRYDDWKATDTTGEDLEPPATCPVCHAEDCACAVCHGSEDECACWEGAHEQAAE